MVDNVTALAIYIPKSQRKKPAERLQRLGKNRKRSVNYLVVRAIARFLGREEP